MENQEINKRLAEIEGVDCSNFNPAENWDQGAALIEKYRVSVSTPEGETPLRAAMMTIIGIHGKGQGMSKKYWKEFSQLPRFSFLLNEDPNGHPVVERFEHKSGSYISEDQCGDLVEEMESKINKLTEELQAYKKDS